MLAYTPKGTPLTTEALAAVDNVHGLLEAGEGCITMSHMVWCMGTTSTVWSRVRQRRPFPTSEQTRTAETTGGGQVGARLLLAHPLACLAKSKSRSKVRLSHLNLPWHTLCSLQVSCPSRLAGAVA